MASFFDPELFSVRGRIACVTGASSGLGRALATALAEAGARVVGLARRADALQAWQDQTDGETVAISADLASPGAMADVAAQVGKPFGAPDILINAAGVNTRENADQVSAEGWRTTIDLNLSIPFFLAKALVPAMREKGWGRIVNFASLQTERAFPGGIAYGASKGGVGQLTRAMAEAWSKDGITANALAPGFFPTELTGAVFDDPERAARKRRPDLRRPQRRTRGPGRPRLVPLFPVLRLRDGADPLCRWGVHGQMKALVYTGPEALEFRDVPEPEAPESDANGDQALIEVAHVGICGSDMHAFLGHDERRPAPLILGHEAAGRVISGPGAGGRVTVNPLVTCGACEDCGAGRENLCARRQIISMPPREGAFAERLSIPAANLVAIPDDVLTENAALAEPIACGWHAVRLARRALNRPIEEARCLVIGGGAIGLGAALVLAAHGAAEIWLAETNPARRAIVAKAGDFRVIDPAKEPVDGVDLVIDGVGFAATRAAASAAARPGGVIVHIGLGSSEGGLDIRRMTLQEITFIGTYTYSQADFRDTAEAIFDGRLGALDWPEIRPLADGAGAFADIKAGRAAAPKIILQP